MSFLFFLPFPKIECFFQIWENGLWGQNRWACGLIMFSPLPNPNACCHQHLQRGSQTQPRIPTPPASFLGTPRSCCGSASSGLSCSFLLWHIFGGSFLSSVFLTPLSLLAPFHSLDSIFFSLEMISFLSFCLPRSHYSTPSHHLQTSSELRGTGLYLPFSAPLMFMKMLPSSPNKAALP